MQAGTCIFPLYGQNCKQGILSEDSVRKQYQILAASAKRVVLHREVAKKPCKKQLVIYFRAVLESAKAKKMVGSSIPEILLETNNWTFCVQL